MSTLPGFNPPKTVSNAVSPAEGPKALPLSLDFTTATSYSFDSMLLQQQGYMSAVQALFVDNSKSATVLTIAVQNGMTLIVPPNSQAFVPIACPQPTTLNFASAGAALVPIVLFNMPMPCGIWSVNAGQALPIAGGAVQVQDAALETAIVSGMMQSQLIGMSGATPTPVITDAAGRLQIQPGEPITLTAHNVAATLATSATLMAANAVRQYLYIKAPETVDLWINPTGGVASIGGAGCIKIPMGTAYESHAYAWSAALTYFVGTAGLVITAFEG